MAKLQRFSLSLVVYLCYSNLGFAQMQPPTKDKQYYIDEAFNKYPQTSQQFRDWLDAAIQIYPNDAQLWREVATSYFKAGDYAPAMRYINKAVELDPKRWLSYRAFMKCIFMKDYANAIQDFRAVLQLNGESAVMDHNFYFYMGVSYLKINQLDSADLYMNRSVAMQLPKGKNWVHYVDWFYWGLVKYKQKDYAKALEYYENSLAQYSNFPDATYYKALILFDKGEKQKAKELLLSAEKSLQDGYRLNEDNEVYVNYPFQITIYEVQALLKQWP